MGQDGNPFSAWYDNTLGLWQTGDMWRKWRTTKGIIVTLQGGVLSGGRREGGIGRVRSALTLLMVW